MSSEPYEQRAGGGRYRGPDRRARSAPAEPPWSPAFLVAGCGLLAGWVAVSLGLADVPGDAALTGALTTATAAVAAATALLCALWWRVSGRTPVLLVAVGVGVLAGTFTLLGVVDVSPSQDGPLAEAAHAAGLLVAIGFVTAASVSPDIDTRRRALILVATAVVAVWVLTPLLAIVGAGAGGMLPPDAAGIAESVVLAAALIAVAVASIVRASRADRFLFAWLGLMLFGLALVEVTALVGRPPGAGTIGRELLAMASVFAGLTGIVRELYAAFGDQRHRLLQSLIEGRAATARVHAQHAAARQQAHDAFSALAAIEGASLTLERAHDRLDADTRAALSASIGSEITRLQRVIGKPSPPDARVAFDLVATLRSVIAHERAEGTDVVADVQEGLTAFGRAPDTAEAATRLLRLARDRAPGRPVLVRAEWAAGQAIIRIEDRGHTGEPPGDLELAVCSQLMTEQDGGLRTEGRGDGGATFVLTLAAVGGPAEDQTPLRAGTERVDKTDERGQIAEVDGLLAVGGDEAPHSGGGPSAAGQLDDGVGDDTMRKASRNDGDVEAGGPAGTALDDDDLQVVSRDDARDDVAEQPRFERDRNPPPD